MHFQRMTCGRGAGNHNSELEEVGCGLALAAARWLVDCAVLACSGMKRGPFWPHAVRKTPDAAANAVKIRIRIVFNMDRL